METTMNLIHMNNLGGLAEELRSPENSRLLSVLAAAIVSGKADAGGPVPDPPKLPDRESATEQTETKSSNAAGELAFRKVFVSKEMSSFYDWLTSQLNGRFRYASIPCLALRLKSCESFPRSTDLETNCRALNRMTLTDEELEGFVRAWMTYDAYMDRWRSEARRANGGK